MGWDFSTEPEFQKKLDWVEDFCKDEVEPLDLIFPYAVRSRNPKIKALVKPLQDQVKEQGLWALFLDKDLGGPGFGQTGNRGRIVGCHIVDLRRTRRAVGDFTRLSRKGLRENVDEIFNTPFSLENVIVFVK